jgi:PAS domain S-box-containing protein
MPPLPEHAAPAAKAPDEPPPDVDSSEVRRLEALRRYDILDTPPEEAFDRLTRLAARHFDVPTAFITLVDAGRQWFKSCFGTDLRETDREISFCTRAIQSEGVTVVENAAEDPRFADNPLVTSARNVRFYAGAPLITPDGHALGTLCLMDTAPRSEGFGAEEQAALRDFAGAAMDALEQRRQSTAHARAQQRASRQRAFAETIIDGLPGIFYFFDAEGRMQQWNDRFADVTGYAPEAIRTMHITDFVAEEDRSHVTEAIAETLQTGTARVELRIESNDGTRTPHLCYGRRLILGGEPYLLGMGVDISKRRRAKQALARRERQYRTLVENVHDVIFQIDAEGRWAFLSPAWEKILGYPVEQSLGRRCLDFVHPDDRAKMEAGALGGRRDDPQAGDWEEGFNVRHMARNGETRWLQVRLRPLPDEDGEEHGAMGTLTDVTDSLHLDAEREARERAEELLEAKTTFLNNMSHELRTPLASITGFAEVLEEEAAGEQQEFAEHIAESGKRLQRTLESVLSLARLDGNAAAMDTEAVDVAAEARRAATAHRPAAREENLYLRVDAPDEATHPRLNAGALYRILDNLLSNAVKFTEEGGVTVHVETGRPASGDESSTETRVRVADTGIGIADDFRAELFEDFRQESTGLSRTHEGSGLGLAITQRLAHLLGGGVEVASEKGEGSAFTVRFPHAPPATREPDEGDAATVAPASASDDAPAGAPFSEGDASPSSGAKAADGGRVLLVEDNPSTQLLARRHLRPRYTVTCAASAEEALQAARDEPAFDVLLIDIALAGATDGTELLDRLRALPGYAETPAIAFTAHAMPGDAAHYREVGFDDYLAKPFSEHDLLDAVGAAG